MKFRIGDVVKHPYAGTGSVVGITTYGVRVSWRGSGIGIAYEKDLRLLRGTRKPFSK